VIPEAQATSLLGIAAGEDSPTSPIADGETGEARSVA
jgi:hypothetical protein